jgi:hypothetical protein
MESNIIRWCFHTATKDNPNALTIYIEGEPLSIFIGYRTANNALLYWNEFHAFIKCILFTRYFKINFGDTRKYTQTYLVENNICDLTFSKTAEYSPYVCLRADDTILYLTKSTNSTHKPRKTIEIFSPFLTIEQFKSLADIKLIENFLETYFRQKNLAIFNSIVTSLVTHWTREYEKMSQRMTTLEFYQRICPIDSEFFLYHSLIDYVASLKSIVNQ